MAAMVTEVNIFFFVHPPLHPWLDATYKIPPRFLLFHSPYLNNSGGSSSVSGKDAGSRSSAKAFFAFIARFCCNVKVVTFCCCCRRRRVFTILQQPPYCRRLLLLAVHKNANERHGLVVGG